MKERAGYGREDSAAAARKTLVTLIILVLAIFTASLFFMVLEGGQRMPEGRRVLAIFPVESSMSGTALSRYAGFGQGLASYFSRTDPMVLGVLGPVSTAPSTVPGSDPLAVGMDLGADIVLIGHEITGDSDSMFVAELFRVDDGASLWKGEFEVGQGTDLRALQIRIGAEVTEVLDLPR